MDLIVTTTKYVMCETYRYIVTVKCRTAIKALFLYMNVCLIVMLDSLSFSITSIYFLANSVAVNKVEMTIIHFRGDDRRYAFFNCFLNLIDGR